MSFVIDLSQQSIVPFFLTLIVFKNPYISSFLLLIWWVDDKMDPQFFYIRRSRQQILSQFALYNWQQQQAAHLMSLHVNPTW